MAVPSSGADSAVMEWPSFRQIVRLGLSLLLVEKLGLRGMWIAMAIELCVRGTLMLWRQKTSKFYETQSRLHGG